MLILDCEIGKSIHINSNVKVKIIKKNGQNISIGVNAPKHIKISRAEPKPEKLPI